MSSNPYSPPQQPASGKPTGEQSPLPLILGIASIALGVLSFFPGCCCGYFAIVGTLGSVGCGIGGLVTAGENQAGKITSVIGVIIGGLVLLFWIVILVLAIMGQAVDFRHQLGN